MDGEAMVIGGLCACRQGDNTIFSANEYVSINERFLLQPVHKCGEFVIACELGADIIVVIENLIGRKNLNVIVLCGRVQNEVGMLFIELLALVIEKAAEHGAIVHSMAVYDRIAV